MSSLALRSRTTRSRTTLALAGLILAGLIANAPAAGAASQAPLCPPSWLGTTLTAHPTVSGDGRFVAFDARSPEGDSGGTSTVLLRDTQRGETVAIARHTATALPYGPVISDDGSRVAYLVATDTSGRQHDLYVYDRRTATSTFAVHADSGSEYDLSADGRYLTYRSAGTNEWDWSITPDVYVRDLDRHRTTLVSVSTTGGRGNGVSESPTISANGRYVLFSSQATNLTTDSATNAMYLRDLVAGTTTLLRDTNGTILTGTGEQLSPDGRYLVSRDSRIYRYDRVTREKVTLGPVPNDDDRSVYGGVISNHGRFVAYGTTFLVGGDAGDAFTQLNVIKVRTGTEEQANPGVGGDQPWTGAYLGAISPNGRYLTFYSDASNLAPGDTNSEFDVFVRDLKANRTVLASAPSPGPAGRRP
jgi:Tol biopolymer transport system component